MPTGSLRRPPGPLRVDLRIAFERRGAIRVAARAFGHAHFDALPHGVRSRGGDRSVFRRRTLIDKETTAKRMARLIRKGFGLAVRRAKPELRRALPRSRWPSACIASDRTRRPALNLVSDSGVGRGAAPSRSPRLRTAGPGLAREPPTARREWPALRWHLGLAPPRSFSLSPSRGWDRASLARSILVAMLPFVCQFQCKASCSARDLGGRVDDEIASNRNVEAGAIEAAAYVGAAIVALKVGP